MRRVVGVRFRVSGQGTFLWRVVGVKIGACVLSVIRNSHASQRIPTRVCVSSGITKDQTGMHIQAHTHGFTKEGAATLDSKGPFQDREVDRKKER